MYIAYIHDFKLESVIPYGFPYGTQQLLPQYWDKRSVMTSVASYFVACTSDDKCENAQVSLLGLAWLIFFKFTDNVDVVIKNMPNANSR